MNLNVLAIATMITITKFWLMDAAARAIIGSHELGRAYRGQLQLVYELLRALQARHGNADAQLRALGNMLTALDNRHDNKARAVYYHLLALRAGSEDPELIALCDELLLLFFPKRLVFVKWSYTDEAGWAESLNEHMTPELRTRLAAVKVGDQTLAELFDAWLGAGMELGQEMMVRSRLETTVSASGASDAAISRRSGRSRWIRTVQSFLDSLDLMGLTDEQLEVLLAPLRNSIATAIARNERGEDPDADAPGDDAPGDDEPSDDEPGDDSPSDGGVILDPSTNQ